MTAKFTDVTMMLENLSRSLEPVEGLLMNASFVIGIFLFWRGMMRIKKLADARIMNKSHEKLFVPVSYLAMGVLLIYLPSSVATISQTAFGSGSILQYGQYAQFSLDTAIGFLLQVIGIVWFMRGCVLLSHSSEPGVQHGTKGLTFLIGGILAINWNLSMSAANSIVEGLTHLSMSFKQITGF